MIINFNSVIELVQSFPDEKSCIIHLESLKWKNGVISPFDRLSRVYKCKDDRYKCKNTQRYFNVKTNTLFDGTKVNLQKWFLAIWLVTSHKKGISSIQLSKDIKVTQKTAWFMLQRIRKCFSVENNNQLNKNVEIDETYIGGKNKNRHANKRIQNTQGRSTKDKAPILGMIERNGKLNAYSIEKTTAINIIPKIINNVAQYATIYTDEWRAYKRIPETYQHFFIKHGIGHYVNGNIHVNTIEGFWAILKRGIFGIYHVVSKKHLQKYIDEFVFRYNTRKMTEDSRFNYFLTNIN